MISCVVIDLISYVRLAGKYPGVARPSFLMSWRRRIGKEEESIFFNGCENDGLEVQHLGSRVYCIKPRETDANETD